MGLVWNGVIAFSILLLHLILYPTATNPYSLSVFGDIAQGIALLMAAIHFSRAAINADRKDASFQVPIALGFWVWVMGHTMLSYSELLLGKPATGTVADAIWLVGYVLIGRSLYLMLKQALSKSEAVRWHTALPVLIGILVCTILWHRLSTSGQTMLVKVEQVLFPFLDLWIAGLAFLLARKSGIKQWNLAGAGSLIIGVADLIFPYFETMSSPVYRYLDIPLFVGYSLWWLAASQATSTRHLSSARVSDRPA